MADLRRGPRRQRRVKSCWDDDDDDSGSEHMGVDVMNDYMENTNIGDDLEAESNRRFHGDLDKDERGWDEFSESDEEEEEEEADNALDAEEERFMRSRNDMASRPVVHNRNSYKRDGAKFSVDEALARHKEDEFELATLMMAKKGSGSGTYGGQFGARDHQGASAYVRYGKDYGDDLLESIYSDCQKIVAFARGREEKLLLGHARAAHKKALFAVANECGIEVGRIGRGRDSRPVLLREDDTRPISIDKMEEIITDVLSYRRQKGRNGRGDRERNRGGPVRMTPKKERQMKELEETANGAPLQESNAGHAMLRMMGWSQGNGLGINKDGRTEPVPVKINSTRKGLGAD
mmetsp:Transcript_4101/g.12321  ORF Transcript_4101/g.12321 Transcript_4101/m.12321 type:complete len:348 (+) Transcript_4101:226-1269(+)|eukprot:CAMPEP_0198731966 /NCGR_PEP_ID=MMETSP1475-20131203/33083_1 /TAXON_ID= ORGANISM="Unidentified sp., Strain CCMP1999" /NCGR_SAMPLE_ID=MMETSP1475 /ASSEMBLY_ACC=CAM_ASM_001111 /LENGTH=347 /DNA_ID=CAMNT_0044494995 /DNA_START=192 /DNA_END=1235 /DNA_ORIENTATION=+